MSGEAQRRPSRSVRWGNPGALIVASIDLPDDVRMPASLRAELAASTRLEEDGVAVAVGEVPFGATEWGLPGRQPEWVACNYALPHRDPGFVGTLLLSLCIEADGHHVGDALSLATMQPVTRGSLLIVDPLVPHWLVGPERRTAPWAAIQWVVPEKQAKDVCREIVARLGGHWRHTAVDPRYAAWRPLGTKTMPTIMREEDMPLKEQHDEGMVPSGDGWTAWQGGQDAPPAALEASREGDVDLAYLDGTRGRRRAEPGAVPLGTFRWTHEGHGDDIVAWRRKRTFVGDLSPVFKRSGEVEVEGVSVGTYAKQDDGRHLFEPWGNRDQVPIVRPRRADLIDAIRAHAAAYAPDRFTTRWEPGT